MGAGLFIDGTGKETVVKAGSITIARPRQSHALRNEKDEPMVFMDVIA
ncbi:cupin domain-containing protein [Selenomonas ruminantium]|nr:cupin domain-containing protein [Selenomonas ruminantium]